MLPVVAALSGRGVAVSVDTMRAEVGLRRGRRRRVVVNDVSGGLADPAMLPAMASLDVPYIAMHWRGHSDRMEQLATTTTSCPTCVTSSPTALAAAERRRGRPAPVVLDPGLGFAKHATTTGSCCAASTFCSRSAVRCLSAPPASGSSATCSRTRGSSAPVDERDAATDAVSALAAAAGPGAYACTTSGSLDAVAVAAAWDGYVDAHGQVEEGTR